MTFLTERQRDVLGFVRRTIQATGIAPTLQEISAHFGFSSTASAQKHVNHLVQKGLLIRDRHQKRGLTLVEDRPMRDEACLPLLGTVAAGSPIESLQQDEIVTVPKTMAGNGRNFALRVTGDSMVDEGIHDGDLIVVRPQHEARDGETVVALVEDEVTLKRFFHLHDGTISLQPANQTMAPIVVPAETVRIQGIVVGLLRTF